MTHDPHTRTRLWVIATMTAVVCAADQLSKAWAWRQRGIVRIDAGGGLLTNSLIGGWWSGAARGAALDVLESVLIAALAVTLVRRRCPSGVFGFAVLALAGWASNVADRLGMHYWTAPGSVRGVVDFQPWAGRWWNVADAAIAAGVAGIAASLAVATVTRLVRLRRQQHQKQRQHRQRQGRQRRGQQLRRPRTTVRPVLASRRARWLAASGLLTTSALATVGAVLSAGVSETVVNVAALSARGTMVT